MKNRTPVKNCTIALLCLLAIPATSLFAESVSYTGTFKTPEDVFETTFALSAAGTVTFQTWGFGGGTNAAGQAIAPGGFDPLLALFSGPPATATIVVDGSNNPLADADNLSNTPWSFVGNCPPAGTVAIGSNSDCGDDFMQTSLAAGRYTLVLTDAGYVPAAVYDNGALSEGFVDLTGGVFQTCDSGSNACITPSGKYAVDILTPRQGVSPVPEPSPLPLLLAGLALLAGFKPFNRLRTALHTKKGAAE